MVYMYVCVIITFFSAATFFHHIESILMCSTDNRNKSFCLIDFYSEKSPKEKSKFVFPILQKISSVCVFLKDLISTRNST